MSFSANTGGTKGIYKSYWRISKPGFKVVTGPIIRARRYVNTIAIFILMIVNERDGLRYIIDGQQRLTSLTLLLVFIHHLQSKQDGLRV